MLLQPGEPVPKLPPAAPAHKVALQVALAARVAPHVVARERQVGQRDEEGRREAVVVLAVAEGGAVAVRGDDVDVQMRHGRVRVDADEDGGGPVAAGGGWG